MLGTFFGGSEDDLVVLEGLLHQVVSQLGCRNMCLGTGDSSMEEPGVYILEVAFPGGAGAQGLG